MLGQFIRQTAHALLMALIVSVLIVAGLNLLPGDLATNVLGADTPKAATEAFKRELNLDKNPISQYAIWLSSAITGDFGKSMINYSNVLETILYRNGNSLVLIIITILLSAVLAMGLMLLYLGNDKKLRNVAIFFSHIRALNFISVGIFLTILLATKMDLLPASSNFHKDVSIGELIIASALPIATLMPIATSHLLSHMINKQMHIQLTPSDGLKALSLALKFLSARLLVYLIPAEVLFDYPGLGALIVQATALKDIPILLNSAILFSWTIIFLKWCGDVIHITTHNRQQLHQHA